MQDEQIIGLYFARDERAIAETEAKYGNYCIGIAHNILQNVQDSEECVNDTWLSAWDSIPPAKPSVLKTYLGKITRNLALDRWRHAHSEKRGSGRISVALDEVHEIISSGYSVSDEYLEREFMRLINHFLHSLPDRERNVFIRRYYFANDIPEIAVRFGITQSNTRKILSRTRQKLKEYLDENWRDV